MSLRGFIILSAFTSFTAFAGAKSVIEVSTSIDSTNYFIGDWIKLQITAEHSDSIIILPPEVGNELGDFQVIDFREFQPRVFAERVRSEWVLTVAAFDTGKFTIPPVEISYQYAHDSTIHKLQTDSIRVEIMSAGGDTLKTPHDIKPPLEAPKKLADFLPYIILIIIAIALALLYLYFKYRRHKSATVDKDEIDTQIDPYQHALHRLVELESRKLYDKGYIKEYWSELTEIIREYFENALNIPALEMTTNELFNAVKDLDILSDLPRRKLFIDADLVKFAKFIPNREMCKSAMKTAEEIIISGKKTSLNIAQPDPTIQNTQHHSDNTSSA